MDGQNVGFLEGLIVGARLVIAGRNEGRDDCGRKGGNVVPSVAAAEGSDEGELEGKLVDGEDVGVIDGEKVIFLG